jgi:hypothetical protein
MTYSITSTAPDGRTFTDKRTKPFPFAILALTPANADWELEARWCKTGLASSRELADKEAATVARVMSSRYSEVIVVETVVAA